MTLPDPASPIAGGERYAPVACDVHDRLESWAVRGTAVDVVWRVGPEERHQRARIADVFARDGADWVTLSTGETLRADVLVSVGGVAVAAAC